MFTGLEDGDGANSIDAFLEERAKDQAGVGSAEAKVGAAAEREVGIGFAVQADLFGGLKGGFVEIRGGPAEGDAALRGNGDAVDVRGDGADAGDVGEGCEHAEKFLAGVDDPAGILAEESEGRRVAAQVGEGKRDGVDDGVAPAREGEVGEAHHLLAGEGASAEGGLGEGTEKIGPRILGRAIEPLVEIFLEGRPFFGSGRAIPENMGAPADPSFRFGFRNVQQMGEGAGLEGQRKFADDLDGGAADGVQQEAVDEVFDLGDHGRVLGAAEEGLDDLAVFGVVRGVGFHGELPHGTKLLLRGNWDAEGSVRGERFPILGRFPDLVMAEDHWDALALELTWKEAILIAGVTKRVGGGFHIDGFQCAPVGPRISMQNRRTAAEGTPKRSEPRQEMWGETKVELKVWLGNASDRRKLPQNAMRFLAMLACLAATTFARGESLPLNNASFESPALAGDGPRATNLVDGWTIEGSAGVFVNNGSFGETVSGADGNQMAYLNGAKSSSIAHLVAPQIQPLSVYTATIHVGLRKDSPLAAGATLMMRLQAFDSEAGKPGRTLAIKEILVGRELLEEQRLTEFTATFTSGIEAPNGAMRISIATGELDKDGKGDWTIDNVRVESNPAPADLAERLRAAAEPSVGKRQAGKGIRYNRDIRPILSENCFACHGPDSASRKAGLRLDRFADATAARQDAAPAFVPGDPDQSEAMRRIVTDDEDDVMPPPKTKKALKPAEKEMIRAWIAEGARYEAHWAYQMPAKKTPPPVRDARWAKNPIDQFLLARLEAEGLAPAPEADARTLARRVSLDLTGLPPTPQMVDAFLKDKSPNAYERYVDELLDSKAWGEHRGRYWLDAARYADTHGIHFDNYREMWTYREWVINAFNANMPFDQFTVEQLAGDLLPNPTLEQLTASGFNRCNITSNEGGLIDEEYYVLYMKDRMETAAQVWMGTTAACAGCHDHKFDPLSQREYYQLAAFFNNSTAGSRDGNKKDPAPVVVIPTDADRARWSALAKETPAARERVEARRGAARPDFETWLAAPDARPFENGILTYGLALHAPLDGAKEGALRHQAGGEEKSTDLFVSQKWIDGHVSAQAFQSSPDFQLKLGDAGDFEKTNSWSFGAWVRIEDKESVGGLIARMDEKDEYRGWDLFLDKDRPVAHFVNKWPDNAVRVASKTRIEPKKWTHLFVTYDGSAKPGGVRIFVNGKLSEADSDNKALTDTIRTTAPLTIAHRHGGGSLKNVGIHDVRVYGAQLAPEAVAALARNTRAAWLTAKPAEGRTPGERDELFGAWLGTIDGDFKRESAALASLEAEDRDIRKRGSIAHVMQEKPGEAMAHLLFRGEYDRRRDRVLAGTPEALPPLPEEWPRNRLGLARWLVSPNHPLTARVAVNRFWQEVFGIGLVRSAGDFGVAGEMPSHPELLDWLAVDFVESGWDVKRFFKNIVMTGAYRQSPVGTKVKQQKDPENRLISRGPRFRMDAEMIRDHALWASGLLVERIGGPSVKPYQPEGVWETVAMRESDTRSYKEDSGENLHRRSLYTFWKRSAPPASMDIFNAPSRETCTVRRERTNTPLQALVTLNDTQFIEAARALAERALKEGGSTARARLNYIAERLLARPLRAEELRVAESVLEDLLREYRGAKGDAELLLAVGETKSDPKLNKPELAAYTMAVNQLMNLDEVLNK